MMYLERADGRPMIALEDRGIISILCDYNCHRIRVVYEHTYVEWGVKRTWLERLLCRRRGADDCIEKEFRTLWKMYTANAAIYESSRREYYAQEQARTEAIKKMAEAQKKALDDNKPWEES